MSGYKGFTSFSSRTAKFNRLLKEDANTINSLELQIKNLISKNRLLKMKTKILKEELDIKKKDNRYSSN